MNNVAIAFVAGAALALLGVLAVKPLLAGEPEPEVAPIEIREAAPATPKGKRESRYHGRAASDSRAEAPAPTGRDDAGFAPAPAAPAPAPRPGSPAPAPSSSPNPPTAGDDDLDDDGALSDDTGSDDDAGED
jgi:hypothetical protein